MKRETTQGCKNSEAAEDRARSHPGVEAAINAAKWDKERTWGQLAKMVAGATRDQKKSS